jgi:hypothetical protein
MKNKVALYLSTTPHNGSKSEWSVTCSSYLWIGGWVILIAGLDVVAKRKIPDPSRNQALVISP